MIAPLCSLMTDQRHSRWLFDIHPIHNCGEIVPFDTVKQKEIIAFFCDRAYMRAKCCLICAWENQNRAIEIVLRNWYVALRRALTCRLNRFISFWVTRSKHVIVYSLLPCLKNCIAHLELFSFPNQMNLFNVHIKTFIWPFVMCHW